MNRRVVLHTVGYILIAEAIFMLLPALVSLIFNDGNALAFLLSAGICAAAGFLLRAIKVRNKTVYAREGFVIVALSWVLMSLFGALPFMLSGEIPNFFNAFFESIAGFSTTGATILGDIEACGESILFWRSFSNWIGGMGVLVFVMVIIPLGGERSIHLVRAEVPGPTKGKLVPKMRETAKILYAIYIGMTVLEIILLCVGGMGLYDSTLTSFATAGTGGFLNYSDSIAHFNSPYFEYVISIFMLLFGVNFNLYYLILIRQGRHLLKNEELRAYLAIVAFAVVTVMLNLRGSYETLAEAFRVSLFQTASVISTTGFLSTDFANWPQYSRTVLLLLMFIGACSTSTGGGIKVSRVIILFRDCKQGISRMLHPRAVSNVHFEGKPVMQATLRDVSIFFIAYMLIATLSILLLSLDNLDFKTNFSVMVSCVNNGGVTNHVMGAAGRYADYSPLSKMVLCFDMLAGRLEIFPMLILFSPTLWRVRKR